MPKTDDVDTIVQDFVADELSSLDKIGSDSTSLQLSPKYKLPSETPAARPQTLNQPKRQSTSSLKSQPSGQRNSVTPSENSLDSPKQSLGEKFKSFRRFSGKK